MLILTLQRLCFFLTTEFNFFFFLKLSPSSMRTALSSLPADELFLREGENTDTRTFPHFLAVSLGLHIAHLTSPRVCLVLFWFWRSRFWGYLIFCQAFQSLQSILPSSPLPGMHSMQAHTFLRTDSVLPLTWVETDAHCRNQLQMDALRIIILLNRFPMVREQSTLRLELKKWRLQWRGSHTYKGWTPSGYQYQCCK